MKKVLALVLCVAMLACFAIPAMAEGVTLNGGEYTAKAGDAIEVIVSADGSLSAGNLIFKYDTAVLKFEKMKKVGMSSDADSAIANEADAGEILFAFASSAPLDAGELVQLNFTVNADAADGDTEVTIEIDNLSVADAQGETTDLKDTTTLNAAKITIGEEAPVDSQPTDSQPTDSEPTGSEPTGSEPAGSEPAGSEPNTVASTDSTAPASTASTASTTNPKTGDAGVVAFAAIIAAAAAAAFVAGKKKA